MAFLIEKEKPGHLKSLVKYWNVLQELITIVHSEWEVEQTCLVKAVGKLFFCLEAATRGVL